MNYLSSYQRANLGFFPTPVIKLPQLSKALGGPTIYMKRDDLTGLALGGNKTRKLEYLMADALDKGADCIITAGAQQSNHCRQTAAACALLNIECHLALGGEPPEQSNGNLLLDELLNAHIHWTGSDRKGESLSLIVEELKSQGKKPYLIPYGGSNELGALGFINAVYELDQQLANLPEINAIVFASSSGGTHAGLLIGKALLGHQYDVQGIAIDKDLKTETPFNELVLALSNNTAQTLAIKDQLKAFNDFTADDILLNRDFCHAGYGVITPAEREAIALTARTEGILLDPVYTGRAMASLIKMIRDKQYSRKDNVLFWHTGGAPAIFAYAESFSLGSSLAQEFTH